MEDAENLKIGIIGCGAIGSGVARAVHSGLHPRAILSAVYDSDPAKARRLSETLSDPSFAVDSLGELLSCSDLVVEAVNSPTTHELLLTILHHKKHLLVMSVGQIFLHPEILDAANTAGVSLLIPSGAVAGIDALKAAAQAGIEEIILTTYKPPQGLAGAPFIRANNIVLENITEETVLFDGNAAGAVEAFPQNINVAATLALATGCHDKLRIRIVTSPQLTHNRHEVTAKGPFGEITTITKNIPSPENPKTSYLAVLSGLVMLKSFCNTIQIGT